MKHLALMIFLLICIAATGCIKNTQGLCVCRLANGDEIIYDLTNLRRSQGNDSCAALSRAANQQKGSCVLE